MTTRQIALAGLASLEGTLSLATLYLLVLLAAAATTRPRGTVGRTEIDCLRFVVLIPAHDEAAGIEATLSAIHNLDYPRHRYQVIVIADNCADRTALLASTAGATVLERHDTERRGKGHALSWALELLPALCPLHEAIAVIDADCAASPNLLTAFNERLIAGASAVQANYLVANSEHSLASRLRFAAFALIATVRPLGKSRLRLSCGLFGTGMGFSRDLLSRQPWKAVSLAEDGEYHLSLVSSGERVVFAPEASVASAMPTSFDRSAQQQLRWEGGKWFLIRAWAPRLVAGGMRDCDPARLHAGLETLVLPQSLLAAGSALLGALAARLKSPLGLRLAIGNVLGQVLFVIGGLLLVKAPGNVYRALALSPFLMMRKVAIYARITMGRGPRSWLRTEREAQ